MKLEHIKPNWPISQLATCITQLNDRSLISRTVYSVVWDQVSFAIYDRTRRKIWDLVRMRLDELGRL
jgi:hypothetical protein